MNGEIPSVPITTLAGVSGLVDLLPEMPLPSPLPQTLSNKSLLFHPRVAEEAQRLLLVNDDNLIPQLVQCLSQTSSRHIELKDPYHEPTLDLQAAPNLLSGILMRKHDVFNGKHEQQVMDWSQTHALAGTGVHPEINQQPQQTPPQMYPALNNVTGLMPPQIHSHHQTQQHQHSPRQQVGNNSLLGHTPPNMLMASPPHHSGLMNNDTNSHVNSLHSKLLFNQQQGSIPPHLNSVPNALNFNLHAHNPLGQSTSDSNAVGQQKSHQQTLQHQHQVPQPAHPAVNQQSLNKQNTVDWSQVHGDLQQSHQPQMYGVNNMPGSVSLHQQPQLTSPPRHPTPPSASIPQVPVPILLPAATVSSVQSIVQNEVHQKPVPSPAFAKVENSSATNSKQAAFVPAPKISQPAPSVVPPVVNSVSNNMMKLQIPRMDAKLLLNKLPSTNQSPAKVPPSEPNRVPADESVESRDRLSRRRNSTAMNPPDSVPVPVAEPKDKKRRGSVTVNPPPEEAEELPKTKIRRVERMLVPVLEKLSSSMITGRGSSSSGTGLDSTTYHRFLKTMGVVLENNDADCDRGEVDLDDDGNVAPELLIPKHQLNELCAEAAKLKALGAMEAIPSDKIVELLKLLEMNIREGCKVTPLADPDDNEEENRLWLELTMESIQRGVAASLTALHILTSQNMPKRVYIEDLIDRIVHFTKFQLQNTIFPTFDPVYRVDSKGKDGFGSGKRKRAHAREVREKNMIAFYNKIHEVVSLLAELLNVQILTDTTVLHLSTLGVSPFFVENVSELQLSALKLVTCIFTQYEKHRRLLLDDILASIARLPSSKRSLRTFKLSAGSEDCIQMLTALVLQLIQCVAHLPENLGTKNRPLKPDPEQDSATKQSNADRDATIASKFDTAVRTAGNFLAVFLNKCGSKSEDCDYKLLFENFLQDLLSTVNKPQWPASELLLSLLGTLLVKNLGNKQLEVSMRVASLEYLGVAAARLRKDAVSAHVRMDTIDRLIADIKAEEEQYSNPSKDESVPGSAESEEAKTEFLQRILLDYLAVHGQDDPALLHARHFYIAAWWKSAESDITKAVKGSNITPSPKKKVKPKKKKRKGDSSEDESEEDSDIEEVEDNREPEIRAQVAQMTEQRKAFLLTKIRPFSDPITSRKTEVLQSYVDYHSADLITRYLASRRPFSASFDFFLTRILSVSSEQTVAIRTKSLKCLTMVVEADANVLARQDMQMWVQHSFLDQSTAVREAAVDLVGKYVLSCHDLIDKYYEILSLRILDTGVSVRKRVIKILRDICVECPQFEKIPEICVKMIRRVNDEDGIRKLVMEVFQNMWFTPVRVEPLDQAALLQKVSNITGVVASCEKVGLDFFEQLLLSLFKPKDDREDIREKLVNQEPPKAVVTASTQIVNCLVEHVLRIEEGSSTGQSQNSSSQRFIACVATLFLFAKIRPQLLVNHAITLQAYLSMKCQNQSEISAIANIANILELVVPLLVNPSESFLSQLEEDCVKLIFKNERSVIDSCLACLGAVGNKITKNYKLVRDVFRRFQSVLANQTRAMKINPNDPRLNDNRPVLRRAVYTIGLFLRHFDFTKPEVYGEFPPDIVANVFDDLLYLLETPGQDLQYFSLQAIGNLCIRHYDYMLGNKLKAIYQQLLTAASEIKLKVQALSNIQLYLVEEELRMIKQDQEWSKTSKSHDIKEMGDVTSGMASTIVQIYLKQILEAFLHSDLSVRLAAVRVVQLVLQQGLVHPIQIVPYLICMSTDEEQGVGTTADKQLQEMEKKHPQFLQSQVLNGIRLSLQLQRILKGYTGSTVPGGFQNSQADGAKKFHVAIDPELPIVRGYRIRPKEAPSALNGFLYSLLRSTKPQRRAIALSLLKLFDEQNKNHLADLLYYADNLAYFPYQVVDEPLFIIHHVDIVISVTGSNLLQAFKESLVPLHPPPPATTVKIESQDSGSTLDPTDGHLILPGEQVPATVDEVIEVPRMTDIMEDDEDEDVDSLLKRIPENTKPLEEFTIGSQGCLLLLMLKQHLKDYYGLTEARISSYSPSDATKTFERPVNRKNTPIFDPKCTIANLKVPPSGSTPESRRALVEQYIHFKQLMLRIDPEEGEEDGEVKQVKIKIDQNLFTYPNARAPVPQGRGRTSIDAPSTSDNAPHLNSRSSTSNAGGAPYYAVMTQAPPPPGTPVAKVEPMVRVPKLTIVPLKFPGNAIDNKKTHKVKEHHHHHHKHKKSKHKKKKRYAVVSDDEDSDNPDSDPDFRL